MDPILDTFLFLLLLFYFKFDFACEDYGVFFIYKLHLLYIQDEAKLVWANIKGFTVLSEGFFFQ